jgi:peptide/nickel transport system permease protein/dipeptide transport system permease protein
MRYLCRKIVGGILTLMAMSFFVFCLESVVQADPARLIAGPAAPPATIEALRMQMGLDEDVFTRYGHFLARIVHGDLGVSVRTRQPVINDIGRYLPATVELAVVALLLGISTAVAVAIVQTAYPSIRMLRLTLVGIGSLPVFLTGLVLVLIIGYKLGWLPGSGRLGVRGFSGPTGLLLIDTLISGEVRLFVNAAAHLVLPASVLALPVAVAVGQVLSSSLHEIMGRGYIRTARGKGYSMLSVAARHGLRNAANAALTMSGLQARLLFGNMLIVERIFAWPGLGMYMVQSLSYSDLPAILGVALVLGGLYVAVGMIVEIAQRLADPRISIE